MEKRILIIDDEQKNIFALNAVLKSRKYSCITAASALEGISILRAEPDIGIVLMDMMMPDMDGYEAIRIIRADKTICSVPVIAVTAQAMKGDREKCLEAGANGYISKPVDVDALLELITQAHQKGGR